MATPETTLLEREPLRQLYDLVASREGMPLDELRAADLPLDPDVLEQYLEVLLDGGFLEREDGHLFLGVPSAADQPVVDRGETVTIRVARRGDLASIKEVIREVAREKTYLEAETVAEELDRDETLVRFDAETSRIFFVATVGGEVVGWLHIEAPERAKLEHTAQFTLGIDPAHRGRGLGKRLMTAGLQWAEAHGYHKVYNDFPATNRGALAFLDSLDYSAHCEAVRRDHYLIDDAYVDQMSLAVYLHDTASTPTHFDRVQRETEELYRG